MQNFKNLIEKRTSLAVIGLGYVGILWLLHLQTI